MIFRELEAYLRLARSAQAVDHEPLLLSLCIGLAWWQAVGVQLFTDFFSSGEHGAWVSGHLEMLVAEARRWGGWTYDMISAGCWFNSVPPKVSTI